MARASLAALLLAFASLAALAQARTAVCFVDSSNPSADFASLQDALYGCGGEGVHSIKLVINGAFDEGRLVVPEHLSSVAITSFERNLDLAGRPVIKGAFELTKSGDTAFELSHVVLDGMRKHPALFYQTTPGAATRFDRFLMLGCLLRGYTNRPALSVKANTDEDADEDDRRIFVAGNAVVSEPDSSDGEDVKEVSPDLKNAMPFPWTLQRAAAYAKKVGEQEDEEKKE